MLTFNGNLKVYVALQPCDMRKSFNGLSEIVRSGLRLDPLSGAVFLFTNQPPQDPHQDPLLGRHRLLVCVQAPRARHCLGCHMSGHRRLGS